MNLKRLFSAPLYVPLLFCALTLLSGCQQTRLSGIMQGSSSSSSADASSTGEPATQSLPPVSGNAAPAPTVATQTATQTMATGSSAESEWRKMLEPYLNNQVPVLTQPGTPTITNKRLLPLSGETVRVGLLLPMSGENAWVGKAMLNAAQMALFDFANTDFELLPYDTAGSIEEASFAASMVIGDGARLIVGPLLASSVHAVAPTARAAGVPVLAFSSDHTVAGSGVYTMGFLPENNVERIVTYALQQGLQRFAVLAPDDAFGATVVSTLSKTLQGYGGSLVDLAFYDASGDDIEYVVRRLADYDNRREALEDMRKELEDKEDEISIKALKRLEVLETLGDLPYEALLIADGGDRLQRVAAMLPFFDIDPLKVRILGTGQWDVPGIGTEPALVGGWFAAPPPQSRISFEEKYQSLYGSKPPRLATLAYDAMALAAVLARGGKDNPYSVEALTAPKGYAGRDGLFRFTPYGVAERGLAILQVRQRENVVINQASKTFTPAIN